MKKCSTKCSIAPKAIEHFAGENEQSKALDHILAVAKSKQFAGKLTNIDEFLTEERKNQADIVKKISNKREHLDRKKKEDRQIHTISMKTLSGLVGIISVGGDALEDSERKVKKSGAQ